MDRISSLLITDILVVGYFRYFYWLPIFISRDSTSDPDSKVGEHGLQCKSNTAQSNIRLLNLFIV